MNRIYLTFLFAFMTFFSFAQTKDYQLSSHILDVSTGKPAQDVVIKLEKLNVNEKWETISIFKTDTNGRVSSFLPYADQKNLGTYKLIFETSSYFKRNNIETFYPFIEVVFSIKDNSHYHVPITISPFGYSTYKGN